MKLLDKENLDEDIKKELEAVAEKLIGYLDNRPNKGADQWVVATTLKIDLGADGNGPMKLSADDVVPKYQVFTNIKRSHKDRAAICNNNCIAKIETLPTKLKKRMSLGHQIHTEIQMLYRNDHNLFANANAKDKVIVVFSHYIPCAQDQQDKGGVFTECAGELANFLVNDNPNNNKFIVFWEGTHKAERTVVPIAQMYMELSGIASFNYNKNTKKIKKDPSHFKRPEYFRNNPMLIRLGRPLMSNEFKFTKTQLLVDCIARNDFLMGKTNNRRHKEIQFVAAKKQLYKAFPMGAGSYGTIRDLARNYGNDNVPFKKAVVEACILYANTMSTDVKKKRLLVQDHTTDYLSFYGTSVLKNYCRNPRFPQEYLQYCKDSLAAVKRYFRIPQQKQIQCQLKIPRQH